MCDVTVDGYEYGDVGDRPWQADRRPVVLVVQPEVRLRLVALPVRHQVERRAPDTGLHTHLRRQGHTRVSYICLLVTGR